MVDMKEYALGDFLSPIDVKDLEDKTAEITGEGILNEDTPFGKAVLEVPVKLSNGTERTYGMNKTSAKNIMEAYGEDTKKWVGKRISYTITQQNVQGQMRDVLYAQPVEEAQEAK